LHYSFDTSSLVGGNTILNQGNGGATYNAKLFNGPEISTTDKVVGSGAIIFSAALSQFVQIPTIPSMGINGLTFAFWFKFSGAGYSSKIFDFGNGPSNDNILFALNDNNDAYVSCYLGGAAHTLRNIFQEKVNDNVWRHALWTINTVGIWQVYLNGAPHSSYETNAYPNAVSRALNYLGKGNAASDPYLNGAIDEFYMFEYVLSAAQVQQLYYSGIRFQRSEYKTAFCIPEALTLQI